MGTQIENTWHGVTFQPDGQTVTYIDLLAVDDRGGMWLLVGTEHDAVEVRVTPKGRSVSAAPSGMKPPSIDAPSLDAA